MSVQDYNGDVQSSGTDLSYDDSLFMAGKAMSINNEPLDVHFVVDIKASGSYEWVEEEKPTGWSYARDTATYSSSTLPSLNGTTIESAKFSPHSTFQVQNEEVPLQSIAKYIHPVALKQLLNPSIYQEAMAREFDSYLEGLEPPEDNFDDFDDDFDDRDF